MTSRHQNKGTILFFFLNVASSPLAVDAAANVRDLNFKYMAEGKGATVSARIGPDKVFQRIYDRAI